jgi:hypothetical protein
MSCIFFLHYCQSDFEQFWKMRYKKSIYYIIIIVLVKAQLSIPCCLPCTCKNYTVLFNEAEHLTDKTFFTCRSVRREELYEILRLLLRSSLWGDMLEIGDMSRNASVTHNLAILRKTRNILILTKVIYNQQVCFSHSIHCRKLLSLKYFLLQCDYSTNKLYSEELSLFLIQVVLLNRLIVLNYR